MIVVACLLTVTIAVSACQAAGTDGDGSRPAFLPETDFAWKAVITAKGPVTSIAAGGPEAVWASDKLGKLYLFNGSIWRTQFTAHDFNNNSIVCICALGSKRAYAVNTNGDSAESERPESVLYSRVFYHPQADFPPTCISGSDADNVLAGTAGGGIYLRINVVPLRIFFPKETFR